VDVKITDLAALQACSPDQVSLYLRANRWIPELVQGGTVWRLANDSDTEVFIPGSATMKSYSAFLADALNTISEVENRSELPIIREIAAASSDVQYIRTKPEGEAGTTSLSDGVRSYEGLKQWLLSAAVYEASDQNYLVQPTRKPNRALDFLRKVRLVPAFPGSFVIAAQIPIVRQMSQQQAIFDDPQLALADQPFERRVSLRLHDATAATLSATHEVLTAGRDVDAFKERSSRGVSANLCEALVNLGGENEVPFEVSFSWAMSRPVEPRPPIKVSPREIEVIQEAARELRSDAPEEDVRIIGGVTRLHREGSLGPGEVSIAGVIEGDTAERLRRVWLQLTEEDYSEATRAHKDGNTVSVRGNLIRRGNRYFLQAASAFQVLQERL
jgi:hypothetical protein